MAKVARVDEAGQVVRRFQVHGSKVRLCYWGGQPEDEKQQWAVRPGMLPDFPDSEVSAPLYQPEGQGGEEGQEKESVRPTTELPRTEIQDEALRTQFKDDSHTERAPQWLEVNDAIMEEQISEEETNWKVRDWLAKTL